MMLPACPETASAAQLQTWLSEAEAAYRRLMTGQQPRVVVDANGERVEFTAVSADSLRRHILDLQARVGAATGCQRVTLTRPIGFYF